MSCKPHLLAVAIIPIALAASSRPASAEGRVGGGLAYGTEIEEFGLQLNGYYDLASTLAGLRVGGEFTYFFASDPTTFWTLNANGHYVFYDADALGIYGLAGLNLSRVTVDIGFGSASSTEIGLNLGAGAEYAVAERVSLFGELKYVVSDFDQAVIVAGARYAF